MKKEGVKQFWLPSYLQVSESGGLSFKPMRKPSPQEVYLARQTACQECIDEVCRKCPRTEIERRAEDGLCPLGQWPTANRR